MTPPVAAETGAIKPRAKSILFYHHYGAPSHIDTFDPKPDTTADVAAMIYWALGLDPSTEIHDRLGRPFKLAEGKPMAGIFS